MEALEKALAEAQEHSMNPSNELLARLFAFVYAALLLTAAGRIIWIISAGTVYAGR